MRHRSCRPCNVYRVLRTECGYALDGNLVASLQFPRSIETTKFEVNFYAERQYNSFLPLLPIWKLALNVLAIGYMMNLPVSFWKSLMEIILSMSDHVILLLPLILDTGETLPSSAGECIQTTYIVHPWIAECSILLFGLIIIRYYESATFTITDLDSMALY